MTQPKVTMAQFKERIRENAIRNSGASSTQPTDNIGTSVTSSITSIQGSTNPKNSGNPLHPDLTEEISRLRQTVDILSRQIYGGQVPGQIGIAKHLQEVEDRLISVVVSVGNMNSRLDKFAESFKQLLEILGVEEEEDAKTQ